MAYETTFDKLTAEERREILDRAQRRRYEDSQFIIEEGRRYQALQVVSLGTVRVSRRNVDVGSRSDVEIARLGEGAVFGELSFLERGRASASVTACGQVEVLCIDGALIHEFIERDESFSGRFYHSLATTLAARLRGTSRRVDRRLPAPVNNP